MRVTHVIFDLDGTLFGETLFDEVEYILEQFKEMGVQQSVASFNPHALFYCQRYRINKYAPRRPNIIGKIIIIFK